MIPAGMWLAVIAAVLGPSFGKDHCDGIFEPKDTARQNLICLQDKVTEKYENLEKEYQRESDFRIKRCFEGVGRGKCGTFRSIDEENVFQRDQSEQLKDCDGCESAFQFLKDNYLVSAKNRDCFNQHFLDEITKRAKGKKCTDGRQMLVDTDIDAFNHMDDLKRSLRISMSWRHSLDVCKYKKAAKIIGRCMAREPKLRKYCFHHNFCFRKRYGDQCTKEPFKSRVGPDSAAAKNRICGCFNGHRREYMDGLKEVADKLTQKAKASSSFDGKACQARATGLLTPMTKENSWKVDWLDVIGPAANDCASLPGSIIARMIIVDGPCNNIQATKNNRLSSVQKSLYFISNFAGALVDRMVRFCRCK